MWRYVLTMYNISGTGGDIKKYLYRTVDPSKLFMYSDFPISILCTLYFMSDTVFVYDCSDYPLVVACMATIPSEVNALVWKILLLLCPQGNEDVLIPVILFLQYFIS